MIKRPNGSRPTQPTTPTFTPTRARSIAALQAQPPVVSGRASLRTNWPASGKCEMGAQRWSATRMPALKQSMFKVVSPQSGAGFQPAKTSIHGRLQIWPTENRP